MNLIVGRFWLKICTGLFFLFLVTACDKESHKTAAPSLVPQLTVATATTILATVSDKAKLNAPNGHQEGDPPKILINEQGRGSVYVAYQNDTAYVVLNGRSGKVYSKIDNLSLSPDGQRAAYGITVNEKRAIVLDGKEGTFYKDVWDPIFSLDGRHIAYIAQVGDMSHIVVDDRITEEAYPSVFSGSPVFSGDSSKVAYHLVPGENRKGRLIINSLDLKKQKAWECNNEVLITNRDKTRIAAVNSVNGKERVLNINFSQPDEVKEGPVFDEISNVNFGADGASLSYVAVKGGKRYLVLNDKEELLPDGDLREPPVIRPDAKGAGVLLVTADGFYLHQAFMGKASNTKKYQEAAGLVYNKDCSQLAFIARAAKNIFMVVNGKDGPLFDMIVKPMFSPDGKLLIYRARKDGKRFVVVADQNGKVVREHPRYEMVFDTTFTADGKSVAYGVKDGDKLVWKVESL